MEIPTIVAPARMIVQVGGTAAVARKKLYSNASKSLPIKFGVARKVINSERGLYGFSSWEVRNFAVDVS